MTIKIYSVLYYLNYLRINLEQVIKLTRFDQRLIKLVYTKAQYQLGLLQPYCVLVIYPFAWLATSQESQGPLPLTFKNIIMVCSQNVLYLQASKICTSAFVVQETACWQRQMCLYRFNFFHFLVAFMGAIDSRDSRLK